MPLKLLAKKSWHVYNEDNVARVRRDEAAAEAREEEDERQRRERESDRRAALLRGEVVDDEQDEQQKWKDAANALAEDGHEEGEKQRYARPLRRERKRRGEDDTDFEMRLAREQRDKNDHSHRHKHARKDESIVDSAGHIDLFGAPPPQPSTAQRDDGPSMRFSDAAGRDGFGTWYTGQAPPKRSFTSSRSDGSNKPRPPLPAPAGSTAADPLAAMKQATAALRALKKERQRETDEQRRAMSELAAEQEDKHGERRVHRDRDSGRRRDGRGSERRDDRDRHRDRDRRSEHRGRHDRDRRHRHSLDDRHDRTDSRRRDDRHRHRSRSPRHRRSKSP